MDPKDFISCFPDEILCHIITFLPFESAVQTTFLSTRWKDLWKKARVLHGTIEDAVVTILSLLNDLADLHPPRNKWGFQFNFGHGRALFAAIAPNNTLHLDFSAREHKLSKSFDWLLPLNLPKRDKWPFPYKYEKILELNTPLPTDQQFKIKALYLISVCRLSSKALTSMVSYLPFLESLTIAKCNGVQSLDIENAARLQKLTVMDCPQLEYLCFGGSCLKSFQYRGRLVCFRFNVFCNCNSYRSWLSCVHHRGLYLEDAMLDFRQGPLTHWTWDFKKPSSYTHYYGLYKGSCNCGCTTLFQCFKSILESTDGVESLTLCRWLFEKSFCKKLPSSSIDFEFCFNELKELWWIDCSMERGNINALLCFLKHCPNLEKLYVTIDPKCYDLPSTEKFSAIFAGSDKLNNLKFVKLKGCADETKEMFLARRLIPLFLRTPLIISKQDGRCLRYLLKVPKLEKKGKYPYKFKMVEKPPEIYPDHVHTNL
ncbi:PREDICTED: F-box protein At2g39490 [Theobroma cacao]|uniref:F-box protein At2g39490 n=1 Tax=Theobroma cacao TaxID=3641 RepID=A0AB32WYZ4_THECC|nr:PREDICTED: F-box protein At2g39490 [Theobroma cacao]